MNQTGTRKQLYEPFVMAALGFAVTAGFGYGASLVLARAFGAPPGNWYSTLVQAHGHAQLFGWVGLFVLGTGLYFLPRVRGANLRGGEHIPRALGLLVTGTAIHVLVQPLTGIWGTNLSFRLLFLLSALLQVAGIAVVLSVLVRTERAQQALLPDSPAYPVEPLAQLAILSLALAFLFNLLGVWNAVSEAKSLLAARYDQAILTLFVYGVVVPMSFVFSIRTLPLFLRVVPSGREVWRTFALVYFVALTLRLVPYLLAMTDDVFLLTGRLLRANFVNVLLSDAIGVGGTLALNVCLVLGVWRLNLTRRRGPRPDRGEYGRFDLLVYSAYIWLVIACVVDFLRVIPAFNELVLIPQDAARHAMTLGFITLLIFGMSVRLLPGLSGKRSVAHPHLVLGLAALGNLAAFLRTFPLFFGDADWVVPLVGASGIVGWVAILLFARVLWGTFRQS